MRSLRFLAAALSLALAFFACRGAGVERDPDLSPDDRLRAEVAFDRVYTVLQHPRCLNCHPDGDRPLQHAAGHAHAMNVVRGPEDRGAPAMRCAGCHGTSNGPAAHLPPGVATGWRLAPREMVFEGRSRAELAAQLRDEERSHLTLEELVHHVEHDALVKWGWEPGPGREPVPVSHADFVDAFRTWVDLGAPIPSEENR